MQYGKTLHAVFLRRPNRFIAEVEIDGKPEIVHVKNTGRCRELLLPGCEVILEQASNPNRKTKYDLICVYKPNLGLVNLDSQAPNQVVGEWLRSQPQLLVHSEYTYGKSRLDFYVEKKLDNGETARCLIEVKGCTLEIDGIGYFPDAPTERGVKHLRELTEAVSQGYQAALVFVIQMPEITQVLPNLETHPEFGEAMEAARRSGVQILCLPCIVTENSLMIDPEVENFKL